MSSALRGSAAVCSAVPNAICPWAAGRSVGNGLQVAPRGWRVEPRREGRRLRLPAASADDDGPSTSGRPCVEPVCLSAPLSSVPRAATALAAALLLLPAGAAHANGGEASPGMLEFVITFIEGLGPWGPAAFVATVALAECIPLFPTQPLSLASGLLFGAQKGALCMLSGTVLAALLAFQVARGVGRPLAERIIQHEMGSTDEGDGSKPGPVQQKLAEVTEAIERGSFWQQAGAVLLLRLTPVVPFSASNYVLGLSPLPLPPYLAGTAAGMAFWSLFYASLGGASRSLLRRGVDPDVLLADMMDKAGAYTRELGTGAVVLGAAAVLYVGAGMLRRQQGEVQGAGNGSSPTSGSNGSSSASGTSNSSSNGASSNGGTGLASSSGGAGPAAANGGAHMAGSVHAAAGEEAQELELAGARIQEVLGRGGQELIESRAKE